MDEKDGYARQDMTPGDNTALYDVKLLESLRQGGCCGRNAGRKKQDIKGHATGIRGVKAVN